MKPLNKLFLLIFFLLPVFSVAQVNYKPGYVVTSKGDTLRGFIDYRDWDTNPTTIAFKANITDPNKQTFDLSNISFVSITGLAAYKKCVCSVSMDATNVANVGTGRDTSFRVDAILLRVLQKGKNVTLYTYTDNLKTRFYIGEAPGYTPTELVYRIYLDVNSGNQKTVYENTFLKQLFALANKYNALDDKLSATFQRAEYTKGDLLMIVSRINNISKAEFDTKYAEHTKINFVAGLAVNISKTSSSISSGYTVAGGIPSTSYLPAVSLGLNLIPNGNSGKIEFRGDISVSETKFNSLFTLKVEPYKPVRASYNQVTFSFAPQIIYNIYNGENVQFYVGAGLEIAYAKFSNPFYGSPSDDPSVPDFQGANPYFFNSLDDALLGKAGVRINKRVEINVTYFTVTASTKGGDFELDNNSIQVGVNYIFGK